MRLSSPPAATTAPAMRLRRASVAKRSGRSPQAPCAHSSRLPASPGSACTRSDQPPDVLHECTRILVGSRVERVGTVSGCPPVRLDAEAFADMADHVDRSTGHEHGRSATAPARRKRAAREACRPNRTRIAGSSRQTGWRRPRSSHSAIRPGRHQAPRLAALHMCLAIARGQPENVRSRHRACSLRAAALRGRLPCAHRRGRPVFWGGVGVHRAPESSRL